MGLLLLFRLAFIVLPLLVRSLLKAIWSRLLSFHLRLLLSRGGYHVILALLRYKLDALSIEDV